MNQYPQLLRYIKSLGEADTYVNTILKGDEIDWNKMDVYPILNIDILTGGLPTTGSTVKFDVELQCLDIRDHNNEIDTDKFWGQDNEVDNHTECHASLNKMHLQMLNDFEENNITILGDESPIKKITREKPNILDGWELSFTVEMPNTTINLCDGCD